MALSSSKLLLQQHLRFCRSQPKLQVFSFLLSFHQNRVRDSVTFAGGQSSRCIYSIAEVPEFESDEVYDYAKATERDTVLQTALTQLAGDFGKESMLSLQRFFSSRRTPVISTGSLKLDLALGIGGLPKGRIIEIYGREASGKTTLALQVIREAQKLGGYCAYFDVENAMDPTLAESMGINTEKLLVAPPDSAENILSSVNTLTKSGSVDVIVVDSVAALVPQCELDVPVGDSCGDVQSRIMTQALKKIHYSLSLSRALIIFVNQVRSNAKSVQGTRHMVEETCGGNALNFYAAVRLGIKRMGLLKTEDEITGLGVCIEVVKNKLARGMKKAELSIKFGKGICCESEVLDLACEHGVIVKEGSSYFIQGNAFHDEYAAQKYLAENHEVHDNIVMMLRKMLFEGQKKL